MKKIICIALLLIILIPFKNFAYSDDFEFLIDVMGIAKINSHGKSLNEEIYNEYSLFVYGSPLDMYEGQRFKEVSQDGHWTKNAGSWNGNGTRGEYWILRRK